MRRMIAVCSICFLLFTTTFAKCEDETDFGITALRFLSECQQLTDYLKENLSISGQIEFNSVESTVTTRVGDNLRIILSVSPITKLVDEIVVTSTGTDSDVLSSFSAVVGKSISTAGDYLPPVVDWFDRVNDEANVFEQDVNGNTAYSFLKRTSNGTTLYFQTGIILKDKIMYVQTYNDALNAVKSILSSNDVAFVSPEGTKTKIGDESTYVAKVNFANLEISNFSSPSPDISVQDGGSIEIFQNDISAFARYKHLYESMYFFPELGEEYGIVYKNYLLRLSTDLSGKQKSKYIGNLITFVDSLDVKTIK